MKRKIITLLLAVFALCVFSSPAMADDADKSSGFYDIGEAQNIELTVFAGDVIVSATEKDVDGDGEEEQWYKDSNMMGVTYTEATPDSNYSIIMVDGRGLPTKDSKIFYINQLRAEDTDVGFNVGIKAPDATTDMSLYISSDVKGFDLINIPVSYAVNVGSYIPGDVNSDGIVDASDIISTRRFITGGWGVTINENAADVDADNAHTAKDVILIRRYLAGGYDVELK